MSRTRTTTLTSGLPALLMIAQGSVSFACKSSCLELDLSRVEWRPPSASVRRWNDTRVRFKQKNVLPLCEIGDVLSRLVCQLQRCSANFVAIGWLHTLDVIRELVLCVQLVVTLIKTEICEILICIACGTCKDHCSPWRAHVSTLMERRYPTSLRAGPSLSATVHPRVRFWHGAPHPVRPAPQCEAVWHRPPVPIGILTCRPLF